ncbi:hypothetical protein ACO2Q8_07935 [Larkinella sp. VNQ87]|uniref:hypothetical protein n=1 Tax=Larkinella sp. VNQ87 TaxID=3400921 RepID=UPI003C0530FA
MVSAGSALKLNKVAAEALGAKEGHRVILVQDADRPNDWYLQFSPVGFLLAENKKHGGCQFLCKGLAQTLRDQFPKLTPPIRIPVATQPTELDKSQEYFALLTKAISTK